MTTTNNHRASRRASQGGRPKPDPTLVGDQACMQPDQDYRQLEASYHHSAQYAAMVQRYPVLKHALRPASRTNGLATNRASCGRRTMALSCTGNAAMESLEILGLAPGSWAPSMPTS